jgi:hypothetical protein
LDATLRPPCVATRIFLSRISVNINRIATYFGQNCGEKFNTFYAFAAYSEAWGFDIRDSHTHSSQLVKSGTDFEHQNWWYALHRFSNLLCDAYCCFPAGLNYVTVNPANPDTVNPDRNMKNVRSVHS